MWAPTSLCVEGLSFQKRSWPALKMIAQAVAAASLGWTEVPSAERTALAARVPPRCFGVFVTVRRSRPLAEWPKDIHGCIGYWDPQFRAQAAELLVAKAFEVGRAATWDDARRLHFPPLAGDAQAVYEVDWMLLPTARVDAETGAIPAAGWPAAFDNDQLGLIVQQGAARATFLPKVFEHAAWSDIRALLVDKAGVRSLGDFYAYAIAQDTTTIYNALARFAGPRQAASFARFVESHSDEGLPYSVGENGDVRTQDDDVRNLAVLLATLRADPPGFARRELGRFVDSALHKYVADPRAMRQASASFLQLLPAASSLNSAARATAAAMLCATLFVDRLETEPEFERGQVAGALLLACPATRRAVAHELGAVGPPVSIFQANWNAYAVWAAAQTLGASPALQRQADAVARYVLPRVGAYAAAETNVAAVAFQALCYLGWARADSDDALCALFDALQRRRRAPYGLYAFAGGGVRVDITAHIVDGLIALADLSAR